MRHRGIYLATAVLALGLVQTADAIPPSLTPPAEETCDGGETAPQLCTLAAALVTAGWASTDDYVVLTPVQSDYEPYCDNGSRGSTEAYQGRLRGPRGIAKVKLLNYLCRGEAPRIAAYAAMPNDGPRLVVNIAQSSGTWVLGAELPTPTQTLISFAEGVPWRHVSYAEGSLHSDESDVTAYATGNTEHCERYSKYNECEEGYRSWEYSVQLQGTVAARLAELTLDVISPADGDRSATVRSESYRDSGWKITRTS